MAIYHANMGNNDKAFESLERGFKDRRVGLVFLKVDYIWDKIRSDPRFADLVRRVGLKPMVSPGGLALAGDNPFVHPSLQ
jgi:adenylate cyclase